MKLKIPQLLGIIAIIAVLGAGLYFFTRSESPASTNPSSDNEVSGSTENAKIAELLKFGESRTCTFSSEDGSGTIYVTSDNLRGDFTTPNGESASMIRNSESTYLWMEGENQGVMMQNQSFSMEDMEENAQSNEYFDANANVNYECSNWSVDQSVFNIPSHIEFMDMSAQMEQIEQQMGDQMNNTEGNISACDTCDKLSGESAEQCRAQLCN